MGRSSRASRNQGRKERGACSTQLAGTASAGAACDLVGIGFNCGMTEELNEPQLIEPGGKTRLYVTGDLGKGMTVSLDEGQSHYLLHVLRSQAGNLLSL